MLSRVAENEETFSAIEGLMEAVGDFCRVRAQDCFPKGNKYGDGGDPRTVFNVLDVMLKDNLERLKTMRFVSDGVSRSRALFSNIHYVNVRPLAFFVSGWIC